MKREFLILLGICFLFTPLLVRAIDISDCSDLDTEGGTYYLTADIIDSGVDTCINISANDVTLSCQGYTIDGTDTSDTKGIYVYRDTQTTTNITLSGCILTDWAIGVETYNANGNTMDTITSEFNTQNGIRVQYSDHTNFINVIVGEEEVSRTQETGLVVQNSNYITIYGIISNYNIVRGIEFYDSYNNSIEYINVENNDYGGLYFESFSGNITYATIIFNDNYGFYCSDCFMNLGDASQPDQFIVDYNGGYGFYFIGGSSNLVEIEINENGWGMYLTDNANGYNLTNIEVNQNYGDGIYWESSYYENLTGITAISNTWTALNLGLGNSVISGATVSYAATGLRLNGSLNNITSISADGCPNYGVYVGGDTNRLIGITISGSGEGIHFYGLTNSYVQDATVTGNGPGLYLEDSPNNLLVNIDSEGNGDGITFNSGSYNNTLRGGILNSNSNGIVVWSDYNVLDDISANGNSIGVDIEGSYNTLSNITTDSNTNYGIKLYSDYSTLTGITSLNDQDGFGIFGGSNLVLSDSKIQDSVGYGIHFLDANSANDVFYNNLLNNTNNILLDGVSCDDCAWNTTRQVGTRIYSEGAEIGGSYWTNPEGNGYSDTCTDIDADGFCDEPLEIASYDYLPLSNEYIPLTCQVINVSRTYVLSGNLTTDRDPCFNITANDVVLDCRGYTIITGLWSENVIRVYRDSPETTNITIKNCNIECSWDYGITVSIKFDNSDYNDIENINFIGGTPDGSCEGYGIGLSTSNHNNISNIYQGWIDECMLELNSANYNNIDTLDFHGFSDGFICMYGSSNNSLNNLYWNGEGSDYAYDGIIVSDSHNNTFTNVVEDGLSGNAIYMDGSYNIFQNLSVLNHGRWDYTQAVYFFGSYDYNTFDCQGGSISGNPALSYTVGFDLSGGSDYNTFKNCIISDFATGVVSTGSNNNQFYNNLWNVTTLIYADGGSDNIWNTTRQEGIRIYSNGTEIGGNYYTNANGTGYSDTCNDLNNDGFCDEPLEIESYDYLPLSDEYSNISAFISITLNFTSIGFGAWLPLNNNVPAMNNYSISISLGGSCIGQLSFLNITPTLTYLEYTIPNYNIKLNYTLNTEEHPDLLRLNETISINVSDGDMDYPQYYLDIPSKQYEGDYTATHTVLGECQ